MYCHDQVVPTTAQELTPEGKTQRHYGITRILRYQVIINNPPPTRRKDEDGKEMQFGNYIAFDNVSCIH